MGSFSTMNADQGEPDSRSKAEKMKNDRKPGKTMSKGKKSKTPAGDGNEKDTEKSKQKRTRSESSDAVSSVRKMPKRAAACSNFKDKSVNLSEKSSVIECKEEVSVEDEIAAIALTLGEDNSRPNRRLSDFIFHDADGKMQPVEMLEVDDLFITGLILPLEEKVSDKEKAKGVRCEGFGRIENWSISGYEDGSPVIWISTDIADYDCIKPSGGYKKSYNIFLQKANACVEVYKKLSRNSGGDPNLTLDELLAGVVRTMSTSKNFPSGFSLKDFIVTQGEFIYNQLISLDDISRKTDQVFTDLPALDALRNECRKQYTFVPSNAITSKNALKICDGGQNLDGSNSSNLGDEEDEDLKLAKLLQEEEYWRSMTRKKGQYSLSSSNKYYIKINEDEIANDYPLPAYYKTTTDETDEYVIFDSEMDICDPDQLPRSMLHNWSLYNSDSRLISLELLPMKPCGDIDMTIYGSGIMTDDDGSGFCLDSDSSQSSSHSAQEQNVDGIPIYLSAIKEWMIEFGSSMVFISIRTDMAWYRLGKPSKQYAPWYQTVLKTAKLAISIITLLKDQSRVSKLSFGEVIKRVCEFSKGNPAYVSSIPVVVERYVVVHGQIILQQFAEFPDDKIRKCAFVTGLYDKMEERHHTKWVVKKKMVEKKEANLNPRAGMGPVVSSRKAMAATTTRLINRIWGEFYSNNLPKNTNEIDCNELKVDEVEEEQEENVDEDFEEVDEKKELDEKSHKAYLVVKPGRSQCSPDDIKWDGKRVGKTCAGDDVYNQATVHGVSVAVGSFVLVETEDSDFPSMYFVEYMFENSLKRKMAHGRLMLRGSETILGNTANEREVFMTNDCLDFELDVVKQTVVVEIQSMPWGHQHRKANAKKVKVDDERAEERKQKGLLMEYYCKSLYSPERGGFFSLQRENMGLGTGICHACNLKDIQREKETFKVNALKTGFTFGGSEYNVNDFVYLAPHHFVAACGGSETYKGGRNVGLKPYVICHLLEIEVTNASKKATPESTMVKVRKFFRPEDISEEKAYCSDIREVYYSDEILTKPIAAIEGKCEVHRKHDIQFSECPVIFEHTFFCERLYDPEKGAVRQLPAYIKLRSSSEKRVDNSLSRKKKGKCKEGETNLDEIEKQTLNRLVTLDIFAGCGGLSEGLQQAGVSQTKWAIEYEGPAGEAFNHNHEDSLTFINNCNVVLRAIMKACGDADDCISTPEAIELAEKLDEKEINNLPRPGQVEFINGGPPCQGFSGMNRFNQSTWSKVQCEMILAFLSFAEYFRPRFFLLENVRNFVSFNKGQTFRLTLASLLEMGYQVRFGILEAGTYGVSQSRKRAFIWAAAPDEILPEWPEPMHVFASPELRISLPGNSHSNFAAVRSTAGGAPFRAITVRDTIGDLPAVGNGASSTTMEYKNEPVSWFQKKIRGDMLVLTDHISKEMNELNLIRCQKIPKRPGADWRDLPDEKVRLSTGQMVDLIPWCLPNTAKRHNQWKGLFGRLDWEGNFPTSITDPQPMGKVGMCFHPDQDRILTVRECARSQGFPDSYKFAGNIQHKHRQIGNAVPPPLAFALGWKLRQSLEKKASLHPPSLST